MDRGANHRIEDSLSEQTELYAPFLEGWPEYERMISDREAWLAEGKGDPQACNRQLVTTYQWLGSMGLALGKPEAVVRDYFCRAAKHCVLMMRLPGSSQGLRVVDIELSVSGNGNAQVDSYRPRPPQVHSGKPSLVAYLEAMRCVIAFGTSDAIDTMAGYGAGDCQIEGLVVGHSVYDSMAGLRAWLRGRDEEARRELRSALRHEYSPGDAALLALTEGDAPRFLRHLGKRLEAHRRQYLDGPLDPDGLVCVHALGLCRMAAAVGLSSMDAPFLPVRLLEPLPRRELTSLPAPTLRSRIRNMLGVE